MKVAIIISYNGAHFKGSQVQKETSNTVMGKLYKALVALQIETKLHASGRTDAGVHAFKQVMHFQVPSFWSDISKLKYNLQKQLPSSIKIRKIYKVSKDFHSRYSAKRRVYRYILCDNRSNPFETDFVTFIDKKIDINTVTKTLKLFEGKHDFVFFKKNGGAEGKTVRTIFKTRVYTYKNKTIFYFEADGFLRSQIRLMVSFILKINGNELTNAQLLEQLKGEKIYNRELAPPNGLYLSNIIY